MIINPSQITPEQINDLEPNDIFVFGSNLRGVHGAGAALVAYEHFGACWGTGWGFTGDCYAIPTKDENIEKMPLSRIEPHVQNFLINAMRYPQYRFLVTAIGCGLAGYKPADIAPLFRCAPISPNVTLPRSFWEVLAEGSK